MGALDGTDMRRSDAESDRFGIEVFRSSPGDIPSSEELLVLAASRRADLVIYRYPCERSRSAADVELGLIPTKVADALIVYELDLAGPAASVVNPTLEFRQLDASWSDQLVAFVRRVFDGYTNHYFANPLLPVDGVLDGYVEWTLGFLGQGDQAVFGLLDGETLAAMATCEQRGERGEGVLYGVSPDYAGKRLYSDLIAHTTNAYRRRGCSAFEVSTQVQNVAVQRAWSRAGFKQSHSVFTMHALPLLGFGGVSAQPRPLEAAALVFGESFDRFDVASHGPISVARWWLGDELVGWSRDT